MSLPPPYPASFNPNVDAAGTVTADSPCRKCGYNLRGLSVSGRCPECGTPVGLSVHGDLLRFSNPRWVRGLQRGVRLIIAALAVAIFGMIAIALAAAAFGPMALLAAALIGLAAYVM